MSLRPDTRVPWGFCRLARRSRAASRSCHATDPALITHRLSLQDESRIPGYQKDMTPVSKTNPGAPSGFHGGPEATSRPMSFPPPGPRRSHNVGLCSATGTRGPAVTTSGRPTPSSSRSGLTTRPWNALSRTGSIRASLISGTLRYGPGRWAPGFAAVAGVPSSAGLLPPVGSKTIGRRASPAEYAGGHPCP